MHLPQATDPHKGIDPYKKAIDPHKIAIARIIAVMFATLGLTAGAAPGRISRALHSAILRVLRPAESSVRRLIAIVAKTIDAKTIIVKPSRPRPPRPFPADLVRVNLGLAIPFREEPVPEEPVQEEPARKEPRDPGLFFRLFDPRQRFFRKPPRPKNEPRARPRITFFRDGEYRTVSFGRDPPQRPADGLETAAHLVRRLQALKAALEDLPGQALRMAHAQARRQMVPRLKLQGPLRPGPAPGARQKPVLEIDHVLERCHWLAREALATPAVARSPDTFKSPDTS